jgi:outer membrane lipoprotein-sorting protein
LCRSRNERRFVGDAKFSPRPGAFRRGAAYLKGMKQLRILMVPVLWAAMALPAAAAEKLSLAEISAYLDDLRSAQGQFTQVNEDGSISTGRILLKRPGRVRFEYDPPEEALVVSNGDTVGIVDPRSNEKQGYPLHRTPLKIILARNVDLTRERMVVGHVGDGVTTTVRAQDPEHPEYGSIDLVFTADPVELRQWIINDSNGGSTTVILGDLRRDVHLADEQFVVPGTDDRPRIQP